jgi:hypothetical protein
MDMEEDTCKEGEVQELNNEDEYVTPGFGRHLEKKFYTPKFRVLQSRSILSPMMDMRNIVEEDLLHTGKIRGTQIYPQALCIVCAFNIYQLRYP